MGMIHIALETLAALSALATILEFVLDEWRRRRNKHKRDGTGDESGRE